MKYTMLKAVVPENKARKCLRGTKRTLLVKGKLRSVHQHPTLRDALYRSRWAEIATTFKLIFNVQEEVTYAFITKCYRNNLRTRRGRLLLLLQTDAINRQDYEDAERWRDLLAKEIT